MEVGNYSGSFERSSSQGRRRPVTLRRLSSNDPQRNGVSLVTESIQVGQPGNCRLTVFLRQPEPGAQNASRLRRSKTSRNRDSEIFPLGNIASLNYHSPGWRMCTFKFSRLETLTLESAPSTVTAVTYTCTRHMEVTKRPKTHHLMAQLSRWIH